MRDGTSLPEDEQDNNERHGDISLPTAIISPTLVQCIEHADSIHNARQAEACQSIFPEESIATHTVAGGTAAVTLTKLGPKLNMVVGLGTTCSASEEDLQSIEHLYSRIGLSTIIDLCPYADKRTLESLAARKYHVVAFLNAYIRSLEDIQVTETIETKLSQSQKDSGVVISHAQPHEHETFVQCSVEGFRDNGRSTELLATLAEIATQRSDTLLFFVKVHGEVAASGALAVIETAYGQVGYFYLGSTIPKFRKRGLHHALDWARLLEARRRSCHLALVETRMGSASGRNAERLGFRVAYTKTFFHKEL